MSFMGSLASWYSFLLVYGFLPLGIPIGFDEASEEITSLPLFFFFHFIHGYAVLLLAALSSTARSKRGKCRNISLGA